MTNNRSNKANNHSTMKYKPTPHHTNDLSMSVLEHVSKEIGAQYLKQVEDRFSNITFEQLKAFVILNDKYGSPTKAIFTTKSSKLLYCSPSFVK